MSKVWILNPTVPLTGVDFQNVVCPESGQRFVPGASKLAHNSARQAPAIEVGSQPRHIYGAGKVRRKKCLINRAPTSFTHWMSV